MDIAVNKTYAVFRTPFSETEDLVQSFSGIRGGGVNDQDPVDFFCAGLVRKVCPDIWHADRLLALSTDEAPPQVIAGADMGGNHALECAVAAETAGAVLTASDIGTLWRDEMNLGWTCLRLLRTDGPVRVRKHRAVGYGIRFRGGNNRFPAPGGRRAAARDRAAAPHPHGFLHPP
jgi:hypothetical protein